MAIRGAWDVVAWANKYGPLFKVQFLNTTTVVLTDPDAVARLTKRTGETLDKGGMTLKKSYHVGLD